MKVYFSNRQKALPLSQKAARQIAKEVLALEGATCQDLSLYFVTSEQISQLHEEFFNDSSVTDCISFPIDDETLGEVFVCPQTALDYCAKHGGDPYEETALYIVHGLLHLLGYDDLEAQKKRIMRKKEKKCMAHLKDLKITLRP